MKKLIVLLFLIPFAVAAQQSIERGDIYYDFFQYKEAAREYESALKNDRTYKNEAHVLTQLAYCYTYTFQYEKAEEKYVELIKLGDNKQVPDIYLEYANILKILGKYEKAKEQINYYVSLFKTGDEYTGMLLKSLAWAEKHKDSVRTRTYVALTNLDVAGQSLGYCFYMDGLLYAKAKDTAYNEYTVLFDLDFAHMQDPLTFIKGEDYVDEIKFPFNEGSPSVTHDGEMIYFTATAIKVKKGEVKRVGTTQISEDGVSNLKIYSARFTNGKFGYVQELSFNNKEYNCTHPCITKEGNALYFASDMPGGFGGLDIYRSIKQADGTWSQPVNLGNKVNTSENEMYPYVADGYLYFTSKGHVGFGGYDLFQSILTNGVAAVPRNMGKPFNSSKDDVAFIIARDGISGYFSSNRDNTNGFDKVYYFNDDISQPKPLPVASAVKDTPAKQTPVAVVTSPTTPLPSSFRPAMPEAVPANGKMLNTVLFGFNLNDVDADFFKSLDSTINLAKRYKAIKLNIYAHADCRGSDAYNMALSKRRAQSVKTYLLGKGVPASRIGMISYGESHPVVTCEPCEACTEEQHRVNRRVEVKVAR
ncbi:MAG: OmpA family protein [Bacteroidota bacterium]